MSIGAIGIGFGWMVLLYQAFKQFKQSKQKYHQKQFKFSLTKNSKTDQEQAKQFPTIKQQTQQSIEEQSEDKKQIQLQQFTEQQSVFNNQNYIIFPQQYPNLKTKIIHKNIKAQDKKKKLKQKRKTIDYKNWFLSNQILEQIQQDRRFSQNQIQEIYASIKDEKQTDDNMLKSNNHQKNSSGHFNKEAHSTIQKVQFYNVFT